MWNAVAAKDVALQDLTPASAPASYPDKQKLIAQEIVMYKENSFGKSG